MAIASRYLNTFDPVSVNTTAKFCNEIKTSYQPRYANYYRILVSCSGMHPIKDFDDSYYDMSTKHESSPSKQDEKVEKMVQDFENQHCQRLNLGMNYSDLNFPDIAEGMQIWKANFTGLSCRTNRTLRFVAIDSILFPSFAESIGIDVFNETHSTVGAIVDAQNENLYVLNYQSNVPRTNAITKRSIVEFIKNFTSNTLPRYLKSSVTTSSSNCLTELDGKQVICVPEVSSDTFASIVLDNKKDVVLMYYAPWCGFCTAVRNYYSV